MKVKGPFWLANTHLAEGFSPNPIIVVEGQDVIEGVIQASGKQSYMQAFKKPYILSKLSNPRLHPALQIVSGIGDRLPKPCPGLKSRQSKMIFKPVADPELGKAEAHPDWTNFRKADIRTSPPVLGQHVFRGSRIKLSGYI